MVMLTHDRTDLFTFLLLHSFITDYMKLNTDDNCFT